MPDLGIRPFSIVAGPLRWATAHGGMRPWRDGALILALQSLVFVPVSVLRHVDGDEGVYLTAAKLVMRGTLPYRDFLYPQTPLLPYVWGPWSVIFGESWLAARLLAALFASLLGAVLYRHLANRSGVRFAIAGLALYLSSNLVFEWFTTVKTQVLSTLLLFCAFAVASNVRSGSSSRWFVGGILLGLAIDTRLIIAAAVPVLVWAAWRAATPARSAVIRFVGGLVVGLVPSLLFFAIDPGRFFFDNLGYHAGRSPSGLIGDFMQKVRVVENLLGIGTPSGGMPQFLLLALAAAACGIALYALTGRVPLSLLVVGSVGLASLLPTPTYSQYFAVVVPFLIVGIVESAAMIRQHFHDHGQEKLLRALGLAIGPAGAAYLMFAATGLYDLVRLYPDQRIGTIQSVASTINRLTEPGEHVLATWPGYMFGSHALPVPGMENYFAPNAADAVSVEEARRYRLATAADVERMIENREPRFVVLKLWHTAPLVLDWDGALRRGRYRLETEVGGVRGLFGGTVKIYVKDK